MPTLPRGRLRDFTPPSLAPAQARQEPYAPLYHQTDEVTREVVSAKTPQALPTTGEVTSLEFQSFYIPEHVFDMVPVAATVSGVGECLQALNWAITAQNLGVDTRARLRFEDAFLLAVKYLQSADAVPHFEDPRYVLNNMSSDQRAAFGITADDFLMDIRDSVQYLVSPPLIFDDHFNMDLALNLLRVLAKFHHHGSLDGPRVFQIGVVTKTASQPTQHYNVQIFNSELGTVPTHTVWMMRDIIGDSLGHYAEAWYPFSLRPGAPAPVKEVRRTAKTTTSAENSDNRVETGTYMETPSSPQTVSNNVAVESSTSCDDSASPKTAPRGKKRKPRLAGKLQHNAMPISNYSHLSVDEILDGAVDPDKLAGEILMELNKHYSYKQITDRLNVVRGHLGRVATGHHNTWKRIQSAMKERETATKTWHQIKDEIDVQRKINMTARGEAQKWRPSRVNHTTGTAATKKSKTAKPEDEDEEELDDVSEDDDAGANHGSEAEPYQVRKSRRASTKVNYALNFQDGEYKSVEIGDRDEVDEDDEEVEKEGGLWEQRKSSTMNASAGKRRRTVKQELSEDSSSEYNGED